MERSSSSVAQTRHAAKTPVYIQLIFQSFILKSRVPWNEMIC